MSKCKHLWILEYGGMFQIFYCQKCLTEIEVDRYSHTCRIICESPNQDLKRGIK
jgi:hypothetical protein